MADLGAIDEDVRFDYGAADRLASLCDAAAGVIEGQTGSRASWKSTALTDFRGHFSELFRSNAAVAAGDATELASRLREVATGARLLKSEARKEQQRRDTARQWKQEQDDRNLWDKGVDAVFGGDDPPVGPPAAEPTIPVSPPVNGTRETPSPGSGGGGGGGTSSARPEDLRAFANGSRGANNALQSKPALVPVGVLHVHGGLRLGPARGLERLHRLRQVPHRQRGGRPLGHRWWPTRSPPPAARARSPRSPTRR